jgi:hypothetical protein
MRQRKLLTEYSPQKVRVDNTAASTPDLQRMTGPHVSTALLPRRSVSCWQLEEYTVRGAAESIMVWRGPQRAAR